METMRYLWNVVLVIIFWEFLSLINSISAVTIVDNSHGKIGNDDDVINPLYGENFGENNEKMKRNYFENGLVGLPLMATDEPQIMLDYTPIARSFEDSFAFDHQRVPDHFGFHHHHFMHGHPHGGAFIKQNTKIIGFGGHHGGFHQGPKFKKTHFSSTQFGRNTDPGPETPLNGQLVGSEQQEPFEEPECENCRSNSEVADDHQVFDPYNQREAIMAFVNDYDAIQQNAERVASPHYYKKYYKKKKYPKDMTYYYFYPHRQDYYYREAVEEDPEPEDKSLVAMDLVKAEEPVALEDDNVQSPNLFGHGPKFSNKYFIQKHAMERKKRSLVNLITDPKLKLDVPKTFENVGTLTKNAVEDERAPLYHLRNLLGSSRNTVLSAMRIPPQNLIVPSDYEIVRNAQEEIEDDSSVLGSSDEGTFRRLGEIIKDSIQSSKDTVSHLNEAAYDARNILTTSKRVIPRIILPYDNLAAVQKPSTVLVTPKIIDTTENLLSRPYSKQSKMVKLGQILDAVGVPSKTQQDKMHLRKLVLKPKSSFKEAAIEDTLNNLNQAKTTVGATSLKDFFEKAKGEFIRILRGAFWYPKENQLAKDHEDEEVEKFLLGLFDQHMVVPNQENSAQMVGSRMYLPPALRKPFMGNVPQQELNEFLIENGDDFAVVRSQEPEIPVDVTFRDFVDFLRSKHGLAKATKSSQIRKSSSNADNDDSNSENAIKPEVYKKIFREPLVQKKEPIPDQNGLFLGTLQPAQDQYTATVSAVPTSSTIQTVPDFYTDVIKRENDQITQYQNDDNSNKENF